MKYSIEGEPMPVLICTLEAGESIVTERGGMSWMSSDFEMKTHTGGLSKAVGRMFSGESIFMNTYTAKKDGLIAFTSCFPGSILAVEISPTNTIIAQKSAFLAAQDTVTLSVHFRKKFTTGLFGGEGFVMQKLTGHGMAFLEIDGYVVAYDLKPGESMIVDTGHLAMMESTVSLDIQRVKGVKNMLFGGEGMFNTRLTGPGKIWIQTMPASSLAGAIRPFLPSKLK